VNRLFDRRRLRRHLIAGLVVIAPITATAFVLWWIFQALDGLLGQFLYPALRGIVPWIELLPGLGLIALLLLLIVVGWAAERAIGSRIVAAWHAMLERFPLTRRIYGAAHSIVRTVFGRDQRPFNQVVIVEWPSPGRWSIGFLAASAPDIVQEHVSDSVSVFVPTTPNPTTGFLVIVPRDKLREIEMTVDQAFTFILSAGSVGPQTPRVGPPDDAVAAPLTAVVEPSVTGGSRS
jgi:uncharacterized membrane protein